MKRLFNYVHYTGQVGAMVLLEFKAKRLSPKLKMLGERIAMQAVAVEVNSKRKLLESEYIYDDELTVKEMLDVCEVKLVDFKVMDRRSK